MSTDAPRNLFFYELCRLCLLNKGACNVFQSSEFVEDIFTCTGVKVTHSEDLPHKICVKCSEVVKSCKELRLLAAKNDAHLRTLFGGPHKDSDCESIRLNQTVSTTCATPSKSEQGSPGNKNHVNFQISSKQKLCLLLKEGEKSDQTTPVIRQTISLRKDLFSSSKCTTPVKIKSPKKDLAHKLLRVKVEQENRCKRIKTDGNITYDCQECNKSFDKYKKLYLHQRLHNKKICCPLDVCGKKFATKGDMEKHIRTHTGERPYGCTKCDKSFSQRVSLRQHVSTLHSDVSSSSP